MNATIETKSKGDWCKDCIYCHKSTGWCLLGDGGICFANKENPLGQPSGYKPKESK